MAKRRWGDRKDARWVREAPAMQVCMAHMYPSRIGCEAYLHDDIDVTELLPFIKAKNESHPEYKTTVFQALIFAVSKMLYERPRMNWFIQGHRIYEHNNITAGFVARRRFVDHSEESLMFFEPKTDDTLDSLSRLISGEVTEMRKSEVATGGVDATIETLKKLPRFIYMILMRTMRYLDFWGKLPKSVSKGDPNFSSVFLTNLGSVGCPSVYHHLNDYGSNSFMVAMGIIKKAEKLMPDGSKQIRDVVDIGVTIDERIGDGFYFIRSLNLVKHLFAHPELMEQTIATPSGFEY